MDRQADHARETRSRLGPAGRTGRHPIRSTMLAAIAAALATIALLLAASGNPALAASSLVNGNFETGALTGWTVDTTYGGSASAVTGYDHPYQVTCTESWGGPCYDIQTISPKEGTYFAAVKSPDQQTKTTRISQPFEASAGDKVSGWAFFASQQNLVNPSTGENDDKAQVVIKSDSGTTVATPYAESVSREGYGASRGWRYWEYAFTQAGKFQIEARVQNAGPSYCAGCTVMGLDDVKTSIAGPDTTPPETYITSGPGSYTTSTSVSFGFSSNEEGSTFECRLTRAGASNLALSEVLEDWTDCTSPRSYSNLDYTYYTFQVRATDPAGNVDPTPAGQFWTSDTSGATRQAFNITSPQNNSYDTDGSFSVSGNASAGSTVELFEGTTSKGTTKADSSSGAWSIALSGVSEGAHTYTARATDAAGYISFAFNSVTVTVRTVPVDTTAPQIDSVLPKEDAPGVDRTTNVTATFSEDMNATSINGQTFKLFKKGSTTKISATVSYPEDSNSAPYTAKLDPTNSLRSGITYQAVVTTGAKDLAGNPLAQQKKWFFTVSK